MLKLAASTLCEWAAENALVPLLAASDLLPMLCSAANLLMVPEEVREVVQGQATPRVCNALPELCTLDLTPHKPPRLPHRSCTTAQSSKSCPLACLRTSWRVCSTGFQTGHPWGSRVGLPRGPLRGWTGCRLRASAAKACCRKVRGLGWLVKEALRVDGFVMWKLAPWMRVTPCLDCAPLPSVSQAKRSCLRGTHSVLMDAKSD